jgi:L-ascorbate metabolism protein UlaG (beta-lactamase superfamily)
MDGLGKRAAGERLARMQASPQWGCRGFVNPEPLSNDPLRALISWTTSRAVKVPTADVPVANVDPAIFEKPASSGLRVTWFGHSSSLVELGERRVLIDPVWSGRVSPVSWAGVRRWYDAPLALEDLPEVDAILISHDHYDHLDRPTVEAFRERDTRWVVPLGVGAHLAYWGIPEERITELDWWEAASLPDLEITCTPARHASGRAVVDSNKTLWGGFVLRTQAQRVYYSGDTGLFHGLEEIGQRLGPFDLTMIEVGAYNQAWPDWHIGPEQAVQAHRWLDGRVLLPVHWGLFNLSTHGWTEPAERVLASAGEAGVRVALPRPGESFEPAVAPPSSRWWPEVPWQTAEQHPVVSTQVDRPTES